VNPVRTCIGCRGREDKSDLIRLTAFDGTVRVDSRQTAPGRGAYLHQERDCWEQAYRKRALPRVLHTSAVDRDRLFAELDALFGDGGAA
jgi:predicted RNA-binding protein YlxR (DUF448 family)